MACARRTRNEGDEGRRRYFFGDPRTTCRLNMSFGEGRIRRCRQAHSAVCPMASSNNKRGRRTKERRRAQHGACCAAQVMTTATAHPRTAVKAPAIQSQQQDSWSTLPIQTRSDYQKRTTIGSVVGRPLRVGAWDGEVGMIRRHPRAWVWNLSHETEMGRL